MYWRLPFFIVAFVGGWLSSHLSAQFQCRLTGVVLACGVWALFGSAVGPRHSGSVDTWDIWASQLAGFVPVLVGLCLLPVCPWGVHRIRAWLLLSFLGARQCSDG